LSHLSNELSTTPFPQRFDAEIEPVTDTGVKVAVMETVAVTVPVWVRD